MQKSLHGTTEISAKVPASCFDTNGELQLTVGFNDLYDLFNLDSLDVGLLRCWTLKMMKLAEEMKCNVGFLDPQIFSTTVV